MPESITPQNLKTALATDDAPVLLDVRRRPVVEAAPDRVPGSSWRDPGEVDVWAAALSQNKSIVVYCVHGHEVSQGVAARLEALGYEVRFLADGIEGWREAGGEVEPRR